MFSRILGRIPLDIERLAPEIERIENATFSNQYSDFVYGQWQSLVLASPSGDPGDTTFCASSETPKQTPIGAQLPYLFELISEHFAPDALRWIRIFRINGGILVPHRDYTEFDDPHVRLNMALIADDNVLHSEGRDVYHMRPGEIWHIDAYRVHSACGLNGAKRLALCLDFECSGKDADHLLRPAVLVDGPKPDMRNRSGLGQAQRDAIRGLSAVLSHDSFGDIAGLLARMHYQYQADAADFFDWLEDIALDVGEPALVARANRYREFCVGERQLYERLNEQ